MNEFTRAYISGLQKSAGILYKNLDEPRPIMLSDEKEKIDPTHIADVISQPRALVKPFVRSDEDNTALAAMAGKDVAHTLGGSRKAMQNYPGVSGTILEDQMSRRRYRATDEARVMDDNMVGIMVDRIIKSIKEGQDPPKTDIGGSKEKAPKKKDTKKAAEMVGPPSGYMGMTHQQYMPQYDRRDNLTGAEENLLAAGESRILPKIFKSEADHPSVDMMDPRIAAIPGGLLGGGIGAIGGGLVGAAIGAPHDDSMPAGVGAGLGGVTGALVGSLLGYHGRKAKNDTLEERIRRLPPGATRRDMMADPLYQKERDREVEMMKAMSHGEVDAGRAKGILGGLTRKG